jgi:hypothetical protein
VGGDEAVHRTDGLSPCLEIRAQRTVTAGGGSIEGQDLELQQKALESREVFTLSLACGRSELQLGDRDRGDTDLPSLQAIQVTDDPPESLSLVEKEDADVGVEEMEADPESRLGRPPGGGQ